MSDRRNLVRYRKRFSCESKLKWLVIYGSIRVKKEVIIFAKESKKSKRDSKREGKKGKRETKKNHGTDSTVPFI